MTGIIHWPDQLFRMPALPEPYLAGASISGGRAVSGIERLVEGEPYWRMNLGVQVQGSAQVLTWHAIMARLKGRSGILSVSAYSCGRSPGALPNYRLRDGSVRHADNTTFSDGSPYSGRQYHAVLAGALAARATSATLALLDTPAIAPWPGMLFSLNGRLHRVETAGPVQSGQCQVTFVPPCRRAVLAGVAAVFDGARGLWRLADEGQAALPGSSALAQNVTLSLVEALEPV